MLRSDLSERIKRLDEDAYLLFANDERLRLILVGGGALVLCELISRSTHDLDALDVSAQLRGLLSRYDINCNVQAFINNFPYNYEEYKRRYKPCGN